MGVLVLLFSLLSIKTLFIESLRKGTRNIQRPYWEHGASAIASPELQKLFRSWDFKKSNLFSVLPEKKNFGMGVFGYTRLNREA